MSDIEYNLIDESWIRVETETGTVKEISLRDALVNAQDYRGLAGEMTAQDIALLRLLIALVHTVVTRYDAEGKKSPVTYEKECIERWRNVWKLGRFPKLPIEDYLTEWRDRFWLFHPERPFYQVPEAVKGTRNGVRKLNGAVSESNNKVRLFSQLSGVMKERMTYPESARWLIFLNGFDDCAAKQADKSDGSRSFTVAWLGKLGLIYGIGDSLFETIMLNMPMVKGTEGGWTADIPTWEPEKARERERETIEMPDDLAGLYTLQSRRIILQRESGVVTGYSILGGDQFEDANALNEPMTLWQIRVDQKTNVTSFRPRIHRRNRFIWRDFSSMTAADNSDVRPGIVSWCDRLRKEGILPKKRLLIFGITCVRYDSSQSSSITDSFSDDVLFHADLLSETGKYWREEIKKEIEKIEQSASYIGRLVADLRRADGLNPAGDGVPADTAKERFFEEIDGRFREWLIGLDADQDAEERNEIAVGLENDIRFNALRIGRELVDSAGDSAFIGRKIKIKKNVNKHYSSPEAYRWFKKDIWNLYPNTKGDGVSER